jgi:hypothetical protein
MEICSSWRNWWFSRAVVYLGCACDNRSQTVFQLFLNSMSTYKCPRQIRSDHGTENVGVARWMLQHFAPASKPILTGLSVHNQRIERLWRDVNTYVISYFRNLFFDLLDPLIEVHLFPFIMFLNLELIGHSHYLRHNGTTILFQLKKVGVPIKYGCRVFMNLPTLIMKQWEML